ncbi:MAG: hypothetical protein AB7T22_06210 [Calditrichaceae bacterium]
MIRALIFKEWLKIRWAFLAILIFSVLILVMIALNIAYDMRMMTPKNSWYYVIFRHQIFYSSILAIPLISGFILGIVQFYPEINASRLKLTLHLPMKTNTILLTMVAIGVAMLLIIYLTTMTIVSAITLNFYPMEVFVSLWITTAAWFLAGLVIYLATGMIFVEPRWWQRIFMMIVSAGFVSTLLISPSNGGYNQYEHALPLFTLFSIFYIISILYSADRFRKGVR